MGPQELFVTFLIVGILLLAIEIIVPGGVLGALAVISLIGAVVTGFLAFGPQGGMVAAFAVLIAGTVILMLWIKVFPKTAVGRVLTLRPDARGWKSADASQESLVGRDGVAQTRLRPGGIAVIDGRRTDVVCDTGFIESGARVKVVRVEGSRIIVRAAES